MTAMPPDTARACVKNADCKYVNDEIWLMRHFDEVGRYFRWSQNEFSHSLAHGSWTAYAEDVQPYAIVQSEISRLPMNPLLPRERGDSDDHVPVAAVAARRPYRRGSLARRPAEGGEALLTSGVTEVHMPLRWSLIAGNQ